MNNRYEALLGTNPTLKKTDGVYEDGLADQDGDSAIDVWELEDGTNPKVSDANFNSKNYVMLQGTMEHKSTWHPPEQQIEVAQFNGTVMRATAIDYEEAQVVPTTKKRFGVKNEVPANFTNSGGNWTASEFLYFRKGVRYRVELLTTSNYLPFISGKYKWTATGNSDELNFKAFGYEVENRQGYVANAAGLPVAADSTLSPNPDVYSTHFTFKSPGQGGPDPTLYATGYLYMPVAEITEVIADQIPGSECNKLPHSFYIGEPNNPMLTATRTQTQANLAVKVNVNEALRHSIYVGARKVGSATVLGSVRAEPTGAKAMLQFGALDGRQLYEVVAGIDANANSQLDDTEAQILFAKTPFQNKEGNTSGPDAQQNKKVLPYSQHSSAQFRDKIAIVTQNDFVSAKANLLFFAEDIPGTDYAGDLLSNFVRGTAFVPTTTMIPSLTISSNSPGISHPLGARWNTSCQDETYQLTFPNGAEASNDFESSKALSQIIDEVIKTNLSSLIAQGSSTPTTSPQLSFSIFKNLALTETESLFFMPMGFNELGFSFGKVTIIGNLAVTYTKTSSNSIYVTTVNFSGGFDDLYDFAFGGGDLAQSASVVQAGHASLTGPPEPQSGKIFFTRLLFDGAKSLNKEFR